MSTRADVHAELDRVRADFAGLVSRSDPESLSRTSDGTRWTNRQLLFHMLFGYLITRNLRLIVRFVSRLPVDAQRAFAGSLNATARPFDVINYWGSVAGGRLLSPERMDAWMGRVITSLHRHLDGESDAVLHRTMFAGVGTLVGVVKTTGGSRPGQGPARWMMRWKPALNAFAITFGDRFPAAETY